MEESVDRVRLTGEFESGELEEAYRRRHAPHDLAFGRVILCTSAVAVLGLGAIDYQLFPGPELIGLWGARIAFVVASALALALLRAPRSPGGFARIFGSWYALTVALHVFVGAVWPAGHIELRMTSALAVLMSYCIMPLPLRMQVAGALLHTGGAVLVAGWLNPPGDVTSVVGDVCWLSVVNVLGAVLAFRTHARQRLLFAALLRQSELSSSLGQALAEVRTLRGLIRVCAWCHKVHAESGWQQLEAYVRDHSHAEFTHGICPICLAAAQSEVASEAG
ncbi:hypothetical protein J8F10_33525 [Gemmata sp. G18]|uniref:Uncharacterized protein n=1 Tax=Gemmata palustris TaxID=2822762 RepID=A0ABS5C2G9_9BACT|nr:hypothetical protein [Gemmata palustris]MBP3960174.1 hypothetical protein [Gemmata palustris]